MAEIIDQRVALALSKQSSQQAPAASGPHDEMSPSNKRKSSVASTKAAPATTEVATPAATETVAPVKPPRYPVDDITMRSSCELHTQVRNKTIVVAFGVAEVPIPGETYLNMEISSSYYAKVAVDRVVESWDDLELEVEGLQGEQTLGEVVHNYILWPKAHIKITQPTVPTSPAPSGMSRGQDQVPSSPGGRERSNSPESARAAKDPSVSPTPSPPKSKGSKRGHHPPPPPRRPKKQRIPKEKPPPPKLPYEKTSEELDAAVRKELDDQIFKKKKTTVEKPIDQVKFHRFLRQKEEEKRRVPQKPPLSDYDRTALKMHKQMKKQKVGSTVPQLGTQSKQSIPPLKVLSEMDQKLLLFGADARLTPAQLLGDEEIENHPGSGRCKYVPGMPLVWERLLVNLPTRMYELHKWHMQMAGNELRYLEVKVEEQHYFRGQTSFNVPMEEFWFLFNQDAVDVSLVSCWVL